MFLRCVKNLSKRYFQNHFGIYWKPFRMSFSHFLSKYCLTFLWLLSKMTLNTFVTSIKNLSQCYFVFFVRFVSLTTCRLTCLTPASFICAKTKTKFCISNLIIRCLLTKWLGSTSKSCYIMCKIECACLTNANSNKNFEFTLLFSKFEISKI